MWNKSIMDFNIEKTISPTTVRLEAATICQLKCPACPTGLGEVQNELGAGILRFEDFKAFIDRYPQIERIELSNWGEIFLNKDLLKILEYAQQQEVELSAGNGVNLNNVSVEVLEGLVRHRFRSMLCSIDGASQKTYEVYRIGGNFYQVINNIRTINKYKQELRSPYPALTWQFVAFGHNEHEISQARQIAKDLNMRFSLKLNWDGLYTKNSFSPIKNLELIRRESNFSVANRDEYREKYGKEYIHSSCLHLWRNPQINFDGRLLGCSINYWGDYGNVFLSPLNLCFNGQKIREARKALMGMRVEVENIPCYRCKFFKMRVTNGTWVKEEEIARLLRGLEKRERLKRVITRYNFGKRAWHILRDWKHRLKLLSNS